MRSALLISLGFHVIVGLISMTVVRFTQVRFVPRDVYVVDIITPAPAQPKKITPAPVVEEKVAPAPVEPEPLPEPEELAPPEKPKKPKKQEKEEPPKKVPDPEPTTLTKTDLDSAQTAVQDVSTGDIALDAEDFEFAYYVTSIKRKIAAFWRVPGAGEERFCIVYFRIQRNGAITTPAVETSSGNLLFDQAALRAVTQANPLPALPAGFDDDYLGVHFSFAYEKQ
jgi:protein TonB